jgi:ATP-dependent DNA helicase RecQ
VQVLPVAGDSMIQALAVIAELRRLSALAPNWDWARSAVIAREWKFLDPLRSYCEMSGIPVQMADEEAPHFWRLRETQALVDWLRATQIKLVHAAALVHWLDGQAAGPWWTVLREAVDEYALETGGAELPIGHFTEWLAEWGREVRRRQTGLLVLTAHRAKGLEFDHVAVLDGGWDRIGHNEDRDAPRRLYYVAMTRARHTLTLARFDRGHPLLDTLPRDASILQRAPVDLPRPPSELAHRYRRLTLADVDLGFAGRHGAQDSVHRAIAALAAGDPVHLRQRQGHWLLLDDNGNTVGRLARAFDMPGDAKCIAARVSAIVVRRRDDGQLDHRNQARCERWEVVVPELTFAPGP